MALFKNLFGQWSRATSLAKGLLCTSKVIFHKMCSINRLRLPPPSILTIFTLGRARGEGGGGRGIGGGLKFFPSWWNISNWCQLMFSEALPFNRLSFARILRQVLWWSVTMVTRYDVVSTRWSSHISVQMHVFSTSFNNKSKNMAKMIQSAYLCVILHVKRKKLPFLAVLTWFLILDKIQDGDHVWWRHRPPAVPPPIKYTAVPHLVQQIKGFPLKAKSFRNTATYQKL